MIKNTSRVEISRTRVFVSIVGLLQLMVCWHSAPENGAQQIINSPEIFEKAFNWAREHQSTPVHYAVQQDNLPLAQVLIVSMNFPVMTVDGNNLPAIYYAVNAGNLAMTNYLLDRDPEALLWRDSQGRTLLHVAVDDGNEEIIELLAERLAVRGLSVDLPDNNGRTPFFELMGERNGDNGVQDDIDLLIALGADPEWADCRGITPLHLAAALQNEDVVLYLLDNYAVPVNRVDNDNRTPLDHLLLIPADTPERRENYDQTLLALINHGAIANLIRVPGPMGQSLIERLPELLLLRGGLRERSLPATMF